MPITKKHRKFVRTNKKQNYKRRTNKRRTNKKQNYKRRTNNSFRGRARGTDSDNNVQCSMCEKIVIKADTLVPQKCLQQYGDRAHRICHKCWWDETTGFAREGENHKCLGCEKKLPFTKSVKGKTPNPEDIIEISD
jgi:hypothetical protein